MSIARPRRGRWTPLSSLWWGLQSYCSAPQLSSYSTYQARSTAAHPDSSIKSVAVLGGGITGLSTAWYLAKSAPAVQVTLYESAHRLGGWLYSKRVAYDNGKEVLFEQGPRTLRPWTVTGLVTIDMIRQLGLEDDISIIPKTSDAAKNRYIYYPDRLNRLPNDVVSTMFSPSLPVMRGVLSGVLSEPFKKRRPDDLTDESVGGFISRRFNRNLSHNLISAVLHGIYAGDVDRLSMKSLFPGLWRNEESHRSLLLALLSPNKTELVDDQILRGELYRDNVRTLRKIQSASVYSFKGGIETLSRTLVNDLKQRPNVKIKTGAAIKKLQFMRGSRMPFELTTTLPSAPTSTHSHVVSTLFGPVTNSILPQGSRIPELASIEAVTVLVVNLYFRTPNLVPVRGFGYLIPKTVPEHLNPERALGVIFDSDATPDPGAPGTKVTLMFGGHWWRGRDTYPDEATAVQMARSVLARHMAIKEEPAATNVTLQRNCIPQYTVGHAERMTVAHEALLKQFDGRLSVAGASYSGVGLNDCVRGARDVVMNLVKTGKHTGLEKIAEPQHWATAVKTPGQRKENGE